jgi:uncharacterized protein (UPF0332 family)
VTPEAGRYLAKARQCVAHSEAILAIGLGDKAGRAAPLAVFHAAQALIHVRTGREAKTHRGVHVQFARLTKDDARFDTPELRSEHRGDLRLDAAPLTEARGKPGGIILGPNRGS